jgi:acyl-coenzyme A thioesterase PaaI-like protein
VWDVEFTDDDGRLCAISRVTLAVRPAPPGGVSGFS